MPTTTSENWNEFYCECGACPVCIGEWRDVTIIDPPSDEEGGDDNAYTKTGPCDFNERSDSMSLITADERRRMDRQRFENIIVAEEFAARELALATGVEREPRLVVEEAAGDVEAIAPCTCDDSPFLRRVYLALAGIAPWDEPQLLEVSPAVWYSERIGDRWVEVRKAAHVVTVQHQSFDVPADALRKAVQIRNEVCEAKRHFPEREDTHLCYGEDSAAEHEAWDAVERMKLTLNHLGRNTAEAPPESHWNVDATAWCEIEEDVVDGYIVARREVYHDANPTPYEVEAHESTDLLDVIRLEEQAELERELDGAVTWSEVKTYHVDPATFTRKRGRTISERMKARNELRRAWEATKAERENRRLLISMIEALGGDPKAEETAEWVAANIKRKGGSKARGYAACIAKLERRRELAAA